MAQPTPCRDIPLSGEYPLNVSNEAQAASGTRVENAEKIRRLRAQLEILEKERDALSNELLRRLQNDDKQLQALSKIATRVTIEAHNTSNKRMKEIAKKEEMYRKATSDVEKARQLRLQHALAIERQQLIAQQRLNENLPSLQMGWNTDMLLSEQWAELHRQARTASTNTKPQTVTPPAQPTAPVTERSEAHRVESERLVRLFKEQQQIRYERRQKLAASMETELNRRQQLTQKAQELRQREGVSQGVRLQHVHYLERLHQLKQLKTYYIAGLKEAVRMEQEILATQTARQRNTPPAHPSPSAPQISGQDRGSPAQPAGSGDPIRGRDETGTVITASPLPTRSTPFGAQRLEPLDSASFAEHNRSQAAAAPMKASTSATAPRASPGAESHKEDIESEFILVSNEEAELEGQDQNFNDSSVIASKNMESLSEQFSEKMNLNMENSVYELIPATCVK